MQGVWDLHCQSSKDRVSAIVKDDWTKCEKIIKHLKIQKNICFKVLMAQGNMEVCGL